MILDRFRLDDRVVLITGASSGLGVDFAVACAEAGADVVVVARRADRLIETVRLVESTGRHALAVTADVSKRSECRDVVSTVMRTFGRLDVLVNNAGVSDATPASRLDEETYQRVMDTNLGGALWMAQAAAEVMRPGSSIVNVASALAVTTIDLPSTAYVASKAGMLGLTRSLARQWSLRKGILVNSLVPGFFPSELTAHGEANAQAHRFLVGRMGEPDELAAALIFLISDAGGYVTGSELVVDGGLSIA